MCSECLFILQKNNFVVVLLAYVDDLALFGEEKLICWVKDQLKAVYKITDLGPLTHFLGVSICEDHGEILMSQKPLLEKLRDETGMRNCKPTRSPLPLSHILYEARSEPAETESEQMKFIPYNSTLGSLLFLSTRTRPDIAAAVSMLGKFASQPCMRHWNAMKYLLRYLKGTADYGLKFTKNSGSVLKAWSDADWARDQDKRRSRSGIVLTIGGNPVCWTSKLQPSVAVSTAEAEFYALSECVRDVNWCRLVLQELDLFMDCPTKIYQDNLGTIQWTSEVQGLRKVKHVGIRYNFVKETVEEKKVEILYTPSQEKLADSLTKSLIGSAFASHREKLHVIPVSARGVLLG